jgi:uncharacterized membrane protein YhaH (DUF805 family)
MTNEVYASPEANLQEPQTETQTLTIKEILFSFKGRIGRKTYWLSLLGTMLIYAVFVGIFTAMTGGKAEPSGIIMVFFALLYIPLIWICLAIPIKRWHDRNKSGWWILIGFVPIIGAIWSFVENGCLSGDEGPNNYGPVQKQ